MNQTQRENKAALLAVLDATKNERQTEREKDPERDQRKEHCVQHAVLSEEERTGEEAKVSREPEKH